MKPVNFLMVCIACLFVHSAKAQQNEVEVTSQRNGNNVEINARTFAEGSYTVFLRFTRLENTNHPRTMKAVIGGDRKITTLISADKERPVNYNYRYFYVRGYHNPRLDSTFVYRLPYSEHRSEPVIVREMKNIREGFFNGRAPRGWKAFAFELSPGDTIFACRKGKVVTVKDGHDPSDLPGGVTYRSEHNSILVEHPDGTLGRYSVFEKNSIRVAPGDVVFPGTPLGNAGRFSLDDPYHIRFSVYYPVIVDEPGEVSDRSVFEWQYYNPYFLTQSGTVQLVHRESYDAATTDELVRKEMTKKEIRNAGL